MSIALSAQDVLTRHWNGHLPVDVSQIASLLGIKVKASFGPDEGASGSITLGDDGVPVIVYDITEPPVRQRFTIAHEIGHWALGHLNGKQKCFRDAPAQFSSNVSVPEERQANNFAAQLLMPENVLSYVVQEMNVTELSKLANIFDVSQAAMSYRITNLRMRLS